jgi:uncharacterized protein (TIGR03083 family)
MLWRVDGEYRGALTTYESAARGFARLVGDIPADRWDGPGLGEWDLRSLVGHTSRSLTTVATYLDAPAERADLTSPQEYYVHANALAAQIGTAGVAERGRQAGKDLGEDPAATVGALVDTVLVKLAGTEDGIIQVIGGQGIWLRDYLPTRTFELAVHGLDIAAAAGISFTPPDDVLADATVLAGKIAVAVGEGATVLMALTGRRTLPASFSVV